MTPDATGSTRSSTISSAADQPRTEVAKRTPPLGPRQPAQEGQHDPSWSVADHATATNGTQLAASATIRCRRSRGRVLRTGGNDVIRVADGKFQIHADGRGGSGETNTLEIRGYHDHSSYAVVDKVTDIDVLCFLHDVDAGISSASNEDPDMEVVFLAGDIGAGRPVADACRAGDHLPLFLQRDNCRYVADPTARYHDRSLQMDLELGRGSRPGPHPYKQWAEAAQRHRRRKQGQRLHRHWLWRRCAVAGGSGADKSSAAAAMILSSTEPTRRRRTNIAGGDDRPRRRLRQPVLILGDNDFTSSTASSSSPSVEPQPPPPTSTSSASTASRRSMATAMPTPWPSAW